MKPCIVCGEPSEASRCPEHTERRRRPSRAAGYDHAWDKLSARARRLQPFCEECGTTENLTTDHSPEAWERKARGLPIRLTDVRVLCLAHNIAAGPARGTNPRAGGSGGRGEARSALHTPRGIR